MFDSWKSRFQSFIGDDDRQRKADDKPESIAKETDILLLRSMLEYLDTRRSGENPADEALDHAISVARVGEETPAEPTEAAPSDQVPPPQGPPLGLPLAEIPRPEVAPAKGVTASLAETDDALATAQRFIAEHRKTAEALLQGISTLEERFTIQAQAAQAARAYAAAKEEADAAAVVAQQAKQLAQTACANRRASAAERQDAEELAAASRADAQTAKAQVVELEQRLREAQQHAAEIACTLDQREARAEQCAMRESEAVAEETHAEEHLAASQRALHEARNEALAAKERAETLKKESLAAATTTAGINDVQNLARRIADAASALTPEIPAGKN